MMQHLTIHITTGSVEGSCALSTNLNSKECASNPSCEMTKQLEQCIRTCALDCTTMHTRYSATTC